jgi:hypothetical protein
MESVIDFDGHNRSKEGENDTCVKEKICDRLIGALVYKLYYQ